MNNTFSRKPWPAKVVWPLVAATYSLCVLLCFMPGSAFCESDMRWQDVASFALFAAIIGLAGLVSYSNRRLLLLMVPAILLVTLCFMQTTGHLTAWTVTIKDGHKMCVIF